MTTLVRRAVRALQTKKAAAAKTRPTFEEVLRLTKGTWAKGDAAAWVRKMRRD